MTTINLKIKSDFITFKNKKNIFLKIIKREIPIGSDCFFRKISKILGTTHEYVSYSNARKDIEKLLITKLSHSVTSDPFFPIWINDMSEICKIFCEFLDEEKISFWIGSKRGCKRYHVDMVPFRVLVTYSGKGTELLPNNGANRDAFLNGRTNKEIIKDISLIRHIDKWNIAIFRGGKEGILHRTPNSALKNNCSSVLMRLDNYSFLKKLKTINKVA